MVIFCDIDGTVADNAHREGFLQGGKKDWDAFYDPARILQDRPMWGALRVLTHILATPHFFSTFIFLTGRPERTREVTNAWFRQHFGIQTRTLETFGAAVAHRPFLIMRGDTDRRRAYVYKEDAITKIVDRPKLFIDDDLRNQAMYSRHGIFLKAPECWEVLKVGP
jgi:hypothetical protein